MIVKLRMLFVLIQIYLNGNSNLVFFYFNNIQEMKLSWENSLPATLAME